MESSIEKFLSQIFWEMCVIWRSSNAYHYLCKCHRNAWSLSTEKSVQSDGSLDWNGGLKTSLKVEPLYYAHQATPYLAMDRTNHPISRHPKREPFLNRLSLCTSCQSQQFTTFRKDHQNSIVFPEMQCWFSTSLKWKYIFDGFQTTVFWINTVSWTYTSVALKVSYFLICHCTCVATSRREQKRATSVWRRIYDESQKSYCIEWNGNDEEIFTIPGNKAKGETTLEVQMNASFAR